MKIMLDTNILISAFVFKSKKMNELIYKLSKEHEIIICSYTVEELKELISTKFKVSQRELDEFFKNFRAYRKSCVNRISFQMITKL